LLVLLSTSPLAHNPTSHGDLLVPAEELGILGHDWDDFPLEVVAVLPDLRINHLDAKCGGILGTVDFAVVNLHFRGPHKWEGGIDPAAAQPHMVAAVAAAAQPHMVVAVAAQSHMVVVAAEARPHMVAAVAVGLVHHMPTAAVVDVEEHRTSVAAVIAVGCSNDLGLNSALPVSLEGMIAAVG
jgi:hypothetical protein